MYIYLIGTPATATKHIQITSVLAASSLHYKQTRTCRNFRCIFTYFSQLASISICSDMRRVLYTHTNTYNVYIGPI